MTDIPPDVTLTDLTTAQIETVKQTFNRSASEEDLAVDFTVTPQTDGLFTITVHFSAKPTVPDTPGGESTSNAATGGQPINFTAGGRALKKAEFDQTIADLQDPEPEMLWALIKKESETLTGFLADRRPVILYERHVFARQSAHRFDDSNPDISGPRYRAGEYGTLANQYRRLFQAMSLDRIAALKACSWGIGQTLGEGATDIGYPSVETMVKQMIQSEGLQMHGVVMEIKEKRVVDAFKDKDFDRFARAYNGDTTGQYAQELQQDFHFYITKGLPDLTVRTAQLYLTYFGNFSHPVDGVFGDLTRQSLLKFQGQTILPASGKPDAATIAELERHLFSSPSPRGQPVVNHALVAETGAGTGRRPRASGGRRPG
jgi:hypothetical protein